VSLWKTYLNSSIFPGLVAWAFGVVYNVSINLNYESEWIDGEAWTIIGILLNFGLVSLMMVSCCTLFLTKIPYIESRIGLQHLVWFSGPSVVIILLGYIMIGEVRESNINYLIIVIPFIVGIALSFFRRSQEHTANSD
jgi:uncharacterized protein YacL